MPHFLIESLGHGPGGFIEGTTTDTGQSILGGLTGEGVESGLSTRTILNRIQAIVDRNFIATPEFQFTQVQVPLFDLRQSITAAEIATNEQITIREQQRIQTNDALINQQNFTAQVQEQLFTNLGDLQQQISNIGQGGFDPIKFLTDNPLLGGIGIGGLAVGAVVLLLVLK